MLTPVKIDQRPNGCWSACVATISGIPLDELDLGIPADADENWFRSNRSNLHNDMQRRLIARGFFLHTTWRRIPKGFAIAGGTSPRGVPHAVVTLDGELWHDPHPSRAGLVSIDEFEILIQIVGSLP